MVGCLNLCPAICQVLFLFLQGLSGDTVTLALPKLISTSDESVSDVSDSMEAIVDLVKELLVVYIIVSSGDNSSKKAVPVPVIVLDAT